MSRYILALDQGTSSSRAILFDERAQVIASHAVALACDFPKPAWVEQDAEALWQSQISAIQSTLAKAAITIDDVAAIGITNQRETTLAWHRDSGEPLAPAIVWQCRRSEDFCTQLKQHDHERWIRQRTGLVIDPYFSASKMRWLLHHIPPVKKLADAGKLCLGTVDSWLIWRLTGGRVFVTDASNASRTQLYNLARGDWDDDLLKLFDIPRHCLATIVDSSAEIARSNSTIIGAEIPICGVAGDQQSALFGQACFDAGMCKHTYGTGGFMLMNTGPHIVQSQHGLLSTVAWQIDGERHYALEGAVFMAGALIQWLRDQLHIIARSDESESLALSLHDNGGVYIVPAFVGLGAPYWNAEARGIICGLTRGSTRAHIARAALEAVAFQTYDLLTAMEHDAHARLPDLRVDGGMTANLFLCQFQADLLQRPVTRPRVIESTALGAALLAGRAIGWWPNNDVLREYWQAERVFQPQQSANTVAQLLRNWQQALARCAL